MSLGTISTGVNTGRNAYFIAIKVDGDKSAANQFLSANNYNTFKGAYTHVVEEDNLEEVESHLEELRNMGYDVDDSGLQEARRLISMVGEEESTSSKTLEQMADNLRETIKKVPGNQRAKMIGSLIENQLEALANEVDEAKKQSFIQDFLAFASKFWKYSLSNQMLIFYQTKGQATKVASYRKWQELGRQVQKGAQSIGIFVPMIKKVEEENQHGNVEERDKLIGFKVGNVFDISQTEPFEPGTPQYEKWKKKNPDNEPFELPDRDIWQSSDNEANEYANTLINAALAAANELGITVDQEADTGSAGGWSRGKEIAIDRNSQGTRHFSTLIHEIAHSIVHFTEDRSKLLKDTTNAEREIDAEATAYLVLKHFGLNPEHAPRYLALWKVNSKEVKARKEHIQKAVKEILTRMHNHLDNTVQAGSWYKQVKTASTVYNIKSYIRHLINEI